MRRILISVLILSALLLAACGASSTQQANQSGNNGGNGAGGGGGNGNFGNQPASLAEQLAIGTLKLEGTSNAVTAKEAAQLLPLWQVYKDMSTSNTAAQQEIDGLTSQIQSTMTPAQVQAITDMKLTTRDVFTAMQDMGISSGRPDASGTPQASSGNRRNGFGGGGFPGGGNGGGFNGQNFSPQQLATLQARRAQNGGSNGARFNRIPPQLFDALIKLLQGKTS